MMSADGEIGAEEREVLKGALRNLSGDTLRRRAHREARRAREGARERTGARSAWTKWSRTLAKDKARAEVAFVLAAAIAFADNTIADEENETLEQRSPRASASTKTRANELLDAVEKDLAASASLPEPRGRRCVEEDATLGRIGGFRLIKRLATGGTSDVLLARAEGPHGFERTVVLKRLLSEHQSDPDFARMFAREAAAYARLSHPAMVRLFDFFTARSGGQLIMVLEYVDGVSLAKLMTHAAQTGQRLDDRVCYFLAARIFDALVGRARRAQPGHGRADAGHPPRREPVERAHSVGRAREARRLRHREDPAGGRRGARRSQGLIKGTYGYMAPEQVRGERVTIRTDVYAASLVLWELLARRKAIQADKLPEMEILRAMAEPNLPTLDVLRPEHPRVDPRGGVARARAEPVEARHHGGGDDSVLRAHFDAERAPAPRARARAARARAPRRRSATTRSSHDLLETSEAESLPSFELEPAARPSGGRRRSRGCRRAPRPPPPRCRRPGWPRLGQASPRSPPAADARRGAPPADAERLSSRAGADDRRSHRGKQTLRGGFQSSAAARTSRPTRPRRRAPGSPRSPR